MFSTGSAICVASLLVERKGHAAAAHALSCACYSCNKMQDSTIWWLLCGNSGIRFQYEAKPATPVLEDRHLPGVLDMLVQ